MSIITNVSLLVDIFFSLYIIPKYNILNSQIFIENEILYMFIISIN
jgi:hypothetical protein